jgi:hypothetical protein
VIGSRSPTAVYGTVRRRRASHILVTNPDRVATILAPMSTDATRTEDDQGATTELVAGTVGDRCTNCSQPLASDQRYCVNCGQRRGKPRFSFESLAAKAPAQPKEPKPHRHRVSSATTLVAGIATLLLAMGVGVLIGHNSSGSTKQAAAAPQVITVGGGGTAASTGSSNSGNATAAAKKKGAKAGKIKTVTVHLTGKVKAKASQAAAKVFGNNGGNLVNNPTEQVGQPCTSGAGCQGGKFTGNFFGGG